MCLSTVRKDDVKSVPARLSVFDNKQSPGGCLAPMWDCQGPASIWFASHAIVHHMSGEYN